MSETLLGVLIGGVIASAMPIIVFLDSRSKWQKEKQITRLQQKKELYESEFAKASKQLRRLLEEKKVGTDIFLFDISLPEEIKKQYKKLMDEKNNKSSIKVNYWQLDLLMKKYIKSIDDAIDKLIDLKKIG